MNGFVGIPEAVLGGSVPRAAGTLPSEREWTPPTGASPAPDGSPPARRPEGGSDWLARVRGACAGSRVVVVDDEPAVLSLTASLLVAAGFRPESFADGDEALAALRREPPDLILLDVLLRGRSGIEICAEIRSDPRLARVPVILVTGAHVSVADQVLGFGVGADDYVLKPWTPEILLSRVAAVLRRVRGPVAERRVHGPLVVDPARREVSLDGALLPLTPTEFHIVHRLVANPDRALTRAELLDDPTDAGGEVAARNVDVHVLAIRRKFGAHRSLLQTVFRVGYRIAPV